MQVGELSTLNWCESRGESMYAGCPVMDLPPRVHFSLKPSGPDIQTEPEIIYIFVFFSNMALVSCVKDFCNLLNLV